jgi:hypothetical protein
MWGTGPIGFIAFCVRASILSFKRLQCRRWVAEEASVTAAVWDHPFLGCYLARIQYQYTVDGHGFTGSHNEPFWTMGRWNGPVQSLPRGTAVQIRYNPQDPARSVFVDPWWRRL